MPEVNTTVLPNNCMIETHLIQKILAHLDEHIQSKHKQNYCQHGEPRPTISVFSATPTGSEPMDYQPKQLTNVMYTNITTNQW